MYGSNGQVCSVGGTPEVVDNGFCQFAFGLSDGFIPVYYECRIVFVQDHWFVLDFEPCRCSIPCDRLQQGLLLTRAPV